MEDGKKNLAELKKTASLLRCNFEKELTENHDMTSGIFFSVQNAYYESTVSSMELGEIFLDLFEAKMVFINEPRGFACEVMGYDDILNHVKNLRNMRAKIRSLIINFMDIYHNLKREEVYRLSELNDMLALEYDYLLLRYKMFHHKDPLATLFSKLHSEISNFIIEQVLIAPRPEKVDKDDYKHHSQTILNLKTNIATFKIYELGNCGIDQARQLWISFGSSLDDLLNPLNILFHKMAPAQVPPEPSPKSPAKKVKARYNAYDTPRSVRFLLPSVELENDEILKELRQLTPNIRREARKVLATKKHIQRVICVLKDKKGKSLDNIRHFSGPTKKLVSSLPSPPTKAAAAAATLKKFQERMKKIAEQKQEAKSRRKQRTPDKDRIMRAKPMLVVDSPLRPTEASAESFKQHIERMQKADDLKRTNQSRREQRLSNQNRIILAKPMLVVDSPLRPTDASAESFQEHIKRMQKADDLKRPNQFRWERRLSNQKRIMRERMQKADDLARQQRLSNQKRIMHENSKLSKDAFEGSTERAHASSIRDHIYRMKKYADQKSKAKAEQDEVLDFVAARKRKKEQRMKIITDKKIAEEKAERLKKERITAYWEAADRKYEEEEKIRRKEESERRAAEEKIAEEKAKREKEERERIAAEEKIAEEKAKREKEERERRAAEEKIAEEKAKREKKERAARLESYARRDNNKYKYKIFTEDKTNLFLQKQREEFAKLMMEAEKEEREIAERIRIQRLNPEERKLWEKEESERRAAEEKIAEEKAKRDKEERTAFLESYDRIYNKHKRKTADELNLQFQKWQEGTDAEKKIIEEKEEREREERLAWSESFRRLNWQQRHLWREERRAAEEKIAEEKRAAEAAADTTSYHSPRRNVSQGLVIPPAGDFTLHKPLSPRIPLAKPLSPPKTLPEDHLKPPFTQGSSNLEGTPHFSQDYPLTSTDGTRPDSPKSPEFDSDLLNQRFSPNVRPEMLPEEEMLDDLSLSSLKDFSADEEDSLKVFSPVKKGHRYQANSPIKDYRYQASSPISPRRDRSPEIRIPEKSPSPISHRKEERTFKSSGPISPSAAEEHRPMLDDSISGSLKDFSTDEEKSSFKEMMEEDNSQVFSPVKVGDRYQENSPIKDYRYQATSPISPRRDRSPEIRIPEKALSPISHRKEERTFKSPGPRSPSAAEAYGSMLDDSFLGSLKDFSTDEEKSSFKEMMKEDSSQLFSPVKVGDRYQENSPIKDDRYQATSPISPRRDRSPEIRIPEKAPSPISHRKEERTFKSPGHISPSAAEAHGPMMEDLSFSSWKALSADEANLLFNEMMEEDSSEVISPVKEDDRYQANSPIKDGITMSIDLKGEFQVETKSPIPRRRSSGASPN